MDESPRKCRRPTLGDVMILVAAAAIASGGIRLLIGTIPRDMWESGPIKAVFAAAALSVPCAAALTVAALVVRLRRPRPARRRLMRQPGVVACGTVVVFAAIVQLVITFAYLKRSPYNSSAFIDNWLGVMIEIFPVAVGYAVLVAWANLAIAGRWRRDPGWIDGLGILVGAYWALVSLIYTYYIL
jgi:hypothetical protein